MRIRNRYITKSMAWFGTAACRMLLATCRKRMYCETPGISPYHDRDDQRFIYSVWHDELVLATFYRRCKKMAALVSRHQDGSYLADAMKILGITTIRGSSSRGGAAALRSLIDEAKGRDITITPDGPRGPRRFIKNGIVFLASRTGRAIVPIAVTCRRFWLIQGSWTDMVVPKPFTTVSGVVGKPLAVPPDLDKAGIARYRDLVQAEMIRVHQKLDCILSGAPADSEPMQAAA